MKSSDQATAFEEAVKADEAAWEAVEKAAKAVTAAKANIAVHWAAFEEAAAKEDKTAWVAVEEAAKAVTAAKAIKAAIKAT